MHEFTNDRGLLRATSVQLVVVVVVVVVIYLLMLLMLLLLLLHHSHHLHHLTHLLLLRGGVRCLALMRSPSPGASSGARERTRTKWIPSLLTRSCVRHGLP